MSKMAELDAEGVTDLHSYSVGVSKERERIIKLLLETPEGLDAMLEWVDHEDQGEAIIALIKGENK